MTVTYSKVHEAWANSPATTTPISAAALDQIEEGVQTAQDTADTATAAATAAVARANHTGTQSSDTLTDGTTSKSFLATERTKLAGIETAATADQTAAELLTAIKTVDGSGSGLDTDVVRATTPGAFGLTILADATAAAHRGTLGTGTATSSNFLRGDGSWSVPAVTAAVVTIADAANDFTATDVEGALAELQTFDESLPLMVGRFDVTTTPGSVYVGLNTGIAGGDTLVGGYQSENDLTLASTSHASKGTVWLLDGDPTYTVVTPDPTFGISTRTITTTANTPAFPAFIKNLATYVNADADGGFTALNPLVYVHINTTYKNDASVAANLVGGSSLGTGDTCFWDNTTVQADSQTIATGLHVSFRSSTIFNVINSGNISSCNYQGYRSAPAFTGDGGTSVTATTATHFIVVGAAVTASATLATQIGLDIPAMTGATTNIGIRNADVTQIADGTAAIPSLSFISDTDSGFYRISANRVGLAVNGALVLDTATTGVAVTGTLSATSNIGYATGAGGAITQATSKATAVTLNKSCGQITTTASTLNASTAVSFTLTNSTIAATDTVLVSIGSGATTNTYIVGVTAVAAGSCRIQLYNCSGSSQSDTLVLNYTVIKAVAA